MSWCELKKSPIQRDCGYLTGMGKDVECDTNILNMQQQSTRFQLLYCSCSELSDLFPLLEIVDLMNLFKNSDKSQVKSRGSSRPQSPWSIRKAIFLLVLLYCTSVSCLRKSSVRVRTIQRQRRMMAVGSIADKFGGRSSSRQPFSKPGSFVPFKVSFEDTDDIERVMRRAIDRSLTRQERFEAINGVLKLVETMEPGDLTYVLDGVRPLRFSNQFSKVSILSDDHLAH